MKLLSKLLLASLILSACGTRKATTTKELEVEKHMVKLESTFQSQDQLVFIEKSLLGNNESNLETTFIREYLLDSNGKPFVSKETISKTSHQKQKNEQKEVKANLKREATNSNNTNASSYRKEVIKNKSVEADKTVATNLGGGSVLVLLVIIVVIALLVYHKRKR